jgi:hypothetical protein
MHDPSAAFVSDTSTMILMAEPLFCPGPSGLMICEQAPGVTVSR